METHTDSFALNFHECEREKRILCTSLNLFGSQHMSRPKLFHSLSKVSSESVHKTIAL